MSCPCVREVQTQRFEVSVRGNVASFYHHSAEVLESHIVQDEVEGSIHTTPLGYLLNHAGEKE